MWTSLAHVASYVLLLTRTNTEVPKHKASPVLVPMDTPGVASSPSGPWRRAHNVTFYETCHPRRVPVAMSTRLGRHGVALGLERGVVGGSARRPLVGPCHRVAKSATGPEVADIESRPCASHRRIRHRQRGSWSSQARLMPPVAACRASRLMAKLFYTSVQKAVAASRTWRAPRDWSETARPGARRRASTCRRHPSHITVAKRGAAQHTSPCATSDSR